MKLAIVVACCVAAVMNAAESGGANAESGAPVVNEKQFHPIVLAVAAGYKKYRKVDEANRWAPTLCNSIDGDIRASASKDGETHGRKLYFLYAANAPEYLKADLRAMDDYTQMINQPVVLAGAEAAEQVIVKESWTPEKAPDGASKKDTQRYAELDGKLYKAGKQADLFMMFKLDKATPGTDDGWVYATVTPDGKSVTSAGRVQSCMDCHQKKSDRLFGLPDAAVRWLPKNED